MANRLQDIVHYHLLTKTKNVIEPLRDGILQTKYNMVKESANANVFTDNNSEQIFSKSHLHEIFLLILTLCELLNSNLNSALHTLVSCDAYIGKPAAAAMLLYI